LIEIYHAMEKIKVQGDDDYRSIWIEVHRGTIDDFGTFEEYRDEEWVETPEEFHGLWLDYYPKETVRMAVALFLKNIPFVLRDALEMITGRDFIGIVPDHITPRYCHSLFPREDNIIDFMNLDHEYEEMIINKAFWYPLEKIKSQFI